MLIEGDCPPDFVLRQLKLLTVASSNKIGIFSSEHGSMFDSTCTALVEKLLTKNDD